VVACILIKGAYDPVENAVTKLSQAVLGEKVTQIQ
jgi:hypothetical protein